MFKKFFKALLEERAGVAVKGFSLLEIMVVITIMTMIMGAVGVGVMSYLDKSKIKQARIDIATISNALDLYKTEFGKYPDSEDGLSRLVEEKILKEKKAPRDPWGNDFIYIYPGSNNEDGFDLYSFGPDGKEGGNDDIVNWDTE
ncbi:MAG TPA: type II secretion system major pseudopilin GspG [bacterium]|jgi:general secretion pathway protein G|nr:type II secretion system major pseudopilin GspG [bacterium]MDX9804486.1 type II secretion system major pseudopilin GspG [bacterium]HNW15706.1 type II secretion system major pseudopilin GspG [bacterium]HNZ52769.1 type II secretion system major pseudopilin GspG [bacterium]HOG43813.1 type II secretion system major pseudopilin GspG [bacterium]